MVALARGRRGLVGEARTNRGGGGRGQLGGCLSRLYTMRVVSMATSRVYSSGGEWSH